MNPPLIFGTNMGLYDSSDQLLNSMASLQLLKHADVLIIRMPFRSPRGNISEVKALRAMRGPFGTSGHLRSVDPMERLNATDWTSRVRRAARRTAPEIGRSAAPLLRDESPNHAETLIRVEIGPSSHAQARELIPILG